MNTRRYLLVCAVLLAAIPLSAMAEVYKVRKGDSLARIGKKFHVTPAGIIELNGLDSDVLKPGDRLKIPVSESNPAVRKPAEKSAKVTPDSPPEETFLYTIEKGETLSEIAETYGMTVKELKALNHIRKTKRIKAGSKILVRKPKEAETAIATAPFVASSPPASSPPVETLPAEVHRESLLARELREIVESPIVKEVRELAEPGKGAGVSAVKNKLVAIAQKMLDIPYRFGGNSILGIDCSGYVQKVFGLLDVVLPRTAREQFRFGEKVERHELSVGDLVFFRTYAKFPSHVGIYLGDNRFIHASSKDRKVKIDNLDAPYYYKRFIGGRRLPLQEPLDEI